MAELTPCPVCRTPNAVGEILCVGCATDLTAPTSAPPPLPPPFPAEPPAHPDPGTGGRGAAGSRCAECGMPQPAGATFCPYCGPSPNQASAGASGRAELLFPWGAEPMPTDGSAFVVGRDSPIAGRLDRYPNVSRRHAEVTVSGNEVFVTDAESTNGTFVNDEPLVPLRRRRLNDGDSVRFAAHLSATVRLP